MHSKIFTIVTITTIILYFIYQYIKLSKQVNKLKDEITSLKQLKSKSSYKNKPKQINIETNKNKNNSQKLLSYISEKNQVDNKVIKTHDYYSEESGSENTSSSDNSDDITMCNLQTDDIIGKNQIRVTLINNDVNNSNVEIPLNLREVISAAFNRESNPDIYEINDINEEKSCSESDSEHLIQNLKKMTKCNNSQSNDIQLDDIQSNDIQSNDIQSNDIQLDDIQSNDIQSNDIQLDDIQLDDIQLNDNQSNDIKLHDIQLNDNQLDDKQLDNIYISNKENYNISVNDDNSTEYILKQLNEIQDFDKNNMIKNIIEDDLKKSKEDYTQDNLQKKSLDDIKLIARELSIILSVKGKAKGKKELITDILSQINAKKIKKII